MPGVARKDRKREKRLSSDEEDATLIWLRRIALALLGRYGARLRYPHLLVLTGALFALDLLVPDLLPFMDEVLLGLGTLLFASWRLPSTSGTEPGPEPDPLDPPGAGGPGVPSAEASRSSTEGRGGSLDRCPR